MRGTFIFSFQLSGWVGRLIVIILFLISIYSWAIILKKFFLFRRVRRATKRFLAVSPLGGSELSLSSEDLKVRKFVHSPLFSLYRKGCSAVSSQLKGERKKIPLAEIEEIRSLLETGATRELSSLEGSLVVLATTTTLSPFLGLLGTVWGILKAFLSMGLEGSAGIETVAPGIAEALITTVVGLLVAIPALVFYNYFTNHLKNFANELESFNSEFISFLKRHYL